MKYTSSIFRMVHELIAKYFVHSTVQIRKKITMHYTIEHAMHTQNTYSSPMKGGTDPLFNLNFSFLTG